jgi:hypothetical protein
MSKSSLSNLMLTLMLALTLLSSCAVYSTGFNCADSKGARCVMLSKVDNMVDSGEIETFHLSKECKGRKCTDKAVNNRPVKQLNKIYKVRIEHPDNIDQFQDGDDLYLK